LVERADVPSLLSWIRARPLGTLPVNIMEDLHRPIRKQAQRDLPALIDLAFSGILGTATVLLVRCGAHITKRLHERDRSGAGPHHLPADLDDQGWVTRFERTSRFVAEISSAGPESCTSAD